jgi:hypothetical protein
MSNWYLLLLPVIFTGCQQVSSQRSCMGDCAQKAANFGELKACEDRCKNPQGVVDIRGKGEEQKDRPSLTPTQA